MLIYFSVIRRCLWVCALLLPLAGGTDEAPTASKVRSPHPADRGLTEADFPRVQEIAPAVYTYEALTGPPNDRYTTNTMFVVTNEGVLVADGQGDAAETGRLVAVIAAITGQPIRYVVVCSDHGDHTNGNAAFPEGTRFIAQRNSVAALEAGAEKTGVLPDIVVDDGLELTLGERTIRILFLGRAHTGGDLFVYLPDEEILFTSEVFLNHMFSGYRTAYPGEWLDVMTRAEALDAKFLIPGHGFIDDANTLAAEWRAYRHHLTYVLDEVRRLHALGHSVDETIELADFGEYSTWSGAESQGPIGIRRIYAELNGELP